MGLPDQPSQGLVVRRVELLDVPAVARLLSPDGVLSRPIPSERAEEARSLMRVTHDHHAVEAGNVWLAERKPGALLGVATWQSGGSGRRRRSRGCWTGKWDSSRICAAPGAWTGKLFPSTCPKSRTEY